MGSEKEVYAMYIDKFVEIYDYSTPYEKHLSNTIIELLTKYVERGLGTTQDELIEILDIIETHKNYSERNHNTLIKQLTSFSNQLKK